MATVSSDGEVAATAVAPVFGGYKVDFLRQLGHGAFGTVYHGWDSNSGLVAIKKISRDEGRKAIEEAVKLQKLKVNLGMTQTHYHNLRRQILDGSHLDRHGEM